MVVVSTFAAAAPAPAAPPTWRVLPEFLYFAALSGATGGAGAYVLAVGPALRHGPAAAPTIARKAATGLGVLGPVLVVALWLQLAVTVAGAGKGMPFGSALSPGAIATYIGKPADDGEWLASGVLTAVQFAFYLAAALVLAALLVPAACTRVRRLAGSAAVLAVVGTAAAAVPTSPSGVAKELGGVFTQLHVLGGTTWLGGLVMLAGLALAARHTPGAGDVWAAVWASFSTLAMAAVGLVLVSGLWLLWMHVGSPAQLLTTTYGRFLLIKLVLVLAMLIAGALNQLSLLPRIARVRRLEPDDTSLLRLTLRHFPRVVALEALLGLAVLVIVPLLSGSARKQAGETGSPELDVSVLLIGVLFAAMLVMSFVAAARLGDRLGRRVPVESAI
ncbi:copper resistance D family protein [Pseudonocardia sp. CA-142604]|uniref:copper resistance D family protein n=1 Tax=Pseudonocardia sp. CA-142604 TaxID=3240024 RepID=UPI003D8FB135